jgi:hypothetical protein
VPAPLLLDIQILGITAVHAPEQNGQGAGLFWNNHKVDVIGHEAIAENAERCICAVVGHQC